MSTTDSTDGDILLAPPPASSSTPPLPSSTDTAGYATHDNTRSPDTGVLNYYFLLLLVLVIVLALVWWSFARRRRNKTMQARENRHSVLARDLQMWPGRWRGGGGVGGWRRGGVEEGVDERGEAPPPYLKELDPVHRVGGSGVELRDLSRGEAKPPGYDEGSVRR